MRRKKKRSFLFYWCVTCFFFVVVVAAAVSIVFRVNLKLIPMCSSGLGLEPLCKECVVCMCVSETVKEKSPLNKHLWDIIIIFLGWFVRICAQLIFTTLLCRFLLFPLF